MKLPEIRREIKSADIRLARLREHRDKLKKLRAGQLLKPQDDRRAQEVLRAIERGWLPSDGIPPEVAEIASGLAKGLPATETEIAEVEERRALLVEQLPSEEEVAAATERASELAAHAEQHRQQVVSVWSDLVGSLEAAETIAQDLVAKRREGEKPHHELTALVSAMGLDVTVPKPFKPEVAESKLAGLLGTLLRRCGYSQEIDASLAGEVADARRSVEREEVAA
ncbi:MAG: hypothetical protein IH936_14565 [Acidobacteria bacterium]|nr:hypothetical protein [Acidobacteriota bacterium]